MNMTNLIGMTLIIMATTRLDYQKCNNLFLWFQYLCDVGKNVFFFCKSSLSFYNI